MLSVVSCFHMVKKYSTQLLVSQFILITAEIIKQYLNEWVYQQYQTIILTLIRYIL